MEFWSRIKLYILLIYLFKTFLEHFENKNKTNKL